MRKFLNGSSQQGGYEDVKQSYQVLDLMYLRLVSAKLAPSKIDPGEVTNTLFQRASRTGATAPELRKQIKRECLLQQAESLTNNAGRCPICYDVITEL
ncbi:hypothetical protein CEXT_326421 [Caerostris extrusa]|uniref:Uncharacterized protein n=1 Tax=Caerostris extrusa TaxID=172846 RepID=A0AAV4WH23_CAEEX|nr:hypothetical protein CEXT_326421 [Caerostris extrusa]